MGINYSTTVAYGIAVKSDVYVDEEDSAKWFEENGFGLLDFEVAGNLMSGEYVHLYYIKDYHMAADMRESEGVVEFESPSLSYEEAEQLNRMCLLLGQSQDKIGWKLVFNVS
jgi:hypothetical protein